MADKLVEYVTLVNARGESQETIPRPEAKARRPELLTAGKYMPVVAVVVINEPGQILVHRRGTAGHTQNVGDGMLDHVYGGIPAGMDPEIAAAKECHEETGVAVTQLQLISAALNSNDFYRYLYVGRTEITNEQLGELTLGTPEETTWVGFVSPDELRLQELSGAEQFAGSFFEDVDAAIKFLANA